MEEKVVSISLKVPEWNVVMNALGARPYGEVASLIVELQRQANEQLKEPTPSQE